MLALMEPRFRKASAAAAAFELRARIVAGTVPHLATLKIDVSLTRVLDALADHFGEVLTEEDRAVLHRARLLRNKLLHCELSRVRGTLNEASPRTRGPHVHALDVEGLDGPDLVARVRGLGRGEDVGQRAVGETATRTLGDVYGWMAEAGSAGEFEEAADAFERAVQVLAALTRAADSG